MNGKFLCNKLCSKITSENLFEKNIISFITAINVYSECLLELNEYVNSDLTCTIITFVDTNLM